MTTGGIETGKYTNYATDEASTRRALEWLKNGAKSRGIDVIFIIGRTLGGWAFDGAIKDRKTLTVVSAAVLGQLADAWSDALKRGELSDLEADMAAVILAAFTTINARAENGEIPETTDELMAAFKKMMEEGGEE